MLDLLRAKYSGRLAQITLVQESYLAFHFGQKNYDYILSVMALHHLLPERKLGLYQRIREALKDRGTYIEGDYVTTPEKENQLRESYLKKHKSNPALADGSHHIDIPGSL